MKFVEITKDEDTKDSPALHIFVVIPNYVTNELLDGLENISKKRVNSVYNSNPIRIKV